VHVSQSVSQLRSVYISITEKTDVIHLVEEQLFEGITEGASFSIHSITFIKVKQYYWSSRLGREMQID